MKIIGFAPTKISIEKTGEKSGQVNINQDIDIKDIKKESILITKDEILKINFKFTISYGSDYAKLEFEGDIILLPEKKEMDEFLKSWKEKKIPETSRVFLFNFIMSKCNVKALSLEDEMGLPLHIPLPRLNPNQK